MNSLIEDLRVSATLPNSIRDRNNEYSRNVVDNIIIGISVLDYNRKTVETTFLRKFYNLFIRINFCFRLYFTSVDTVDRIFPNFQLFHLTYV